jgi:hypothetical protein
LNGECGALVGAATWGSLLGGTTFDPELMRGWNKRANNWEFTAGVQHQLAPRVGLDIQFARRSYGNFRITDDLNVSASDYQQFSLTVPNDPRLPNGGGNTLTFYDLTTAGFATAPRYFVTHAKNYGEQTEVFTGVNIGVNARLANGLTVQGGLGPGRVVTDDCDLVDELPEMLHTLAGNPTRSPVFAARPLERCRQNNGWRTGVQGLAAYIIPKIDVNISATFQNQPGAQLDANWLTGTGASNLGRSFSSGGNRSFNIVEAGEVYIERMNQIDLRLSKIFRVAGTRTMLNFDFYNVSNSNSILTENATYTAQPPPGANPATWRSPTVILLPRLFKLGLQVDF